MTTEQMKKAAKGAAAGAGGLNITDMTKVLNKHGIATNKSMNRSDLNKLMGHLVESISPSSARSSTPSKKRYLEKPGNLTVDDVPSKKLLRKTGRLSAAEYHRTFGGIGDICDIRGDGELKCLQPRGNSAFWLGKGTNIPNDCLPWKLRCKI